MRNIAQKVMRHLRGNPTRLFLTPPKANPDRSGFAVVLIARNEEHHILDWLRFHSLAGAQAAIIYDNGSDDDTGRLARDFSGMETHVLPWITDIKLGPTPLKRQPLAYAHAICTFGARFRWMACIDIDEYIVPVSASSIPEALEDLSVFSNISLPWTMFGTSGQREPPEKPAVYAYETRARHRLPAFTNFKCIVDPCEVTRVSTHKFLTRSLGPATVNDEGKLANNHKRRSGSFATATRLQLNHYYTFSEVELERKLSRETVSHQGSAERAQVVRRIAKLIDEDTVPDQLAAQFLTRLGYSDWRRFRALA